MIGSKISRSFQKKFKKNVATILKFTFEIGPNHCVKNSKFLSNSFLKFMFEIVPGSPIFHY